jgi:prepilin-type N-terminal cleavage/methylation domain-containing protein
MAKSGFTLLETLLAIILFSLGMLVVVDSLTAITRLGARGRARGRVALALGSRADWLRAEARRSDCTLPGSGVNRRPDGVAETWSTRMIDGLIEGVIIARGPDRSALPDTIVLRFPCS